MKFQRFIMLRKVLIFVAISLTALSAQSGNPISKTFNLEALYGYTWLNHPQKGNLHEAGVRAIFFSENFSHEILGRASFASSTKKSGYDTKYSGWEAEYRFGARMDNDMAALGMLSGSAYLGVGYQSVTQKYTSYKLTTQHIYMPFGFWGEDSTSVDGLKVRYGLNFKAVFFNDNNATIDANGASKQKLEFDFLLGGKIYAGVGYSIGGVMDIFLQAFFSYNAPFKNFRQYGLEVGVQF